MAKPTGKTITGSSKNDELFGSSGNDHILGLGGNDYIYGLDGDDRILGGTGEDFLYGGNGNDFLDGGNDNDRIFGDAGNDTLKGDFGDDMLNGGEGDDFIDGDKGNDTIVGGIGNDIISGGSGDDVLYIETSGKHYSSFDGDQGVDTISFNQNSKPYDYIFNYTAKEGGIINWNDGSGSLKFTKTENVVLGSGNDTLNISFYDDDIMIDGAKGTNTLNFKEAITKDFFNQFKDDLTGSFTLKNGKSILFGPKENFTLAEILSKYSNGTFNINSKTALSGKIGNAAFNNFQHITARIVCFGAGTHITTDQGHKTVETLKAGDRILTMDQGYQPISWIGGRTLSARDLTANPHLRPIRIRAGVLGHDQPARDLIVSPQHRILVRSAIARRMFGETEVLVAAKQLLAIDGIEIAHDLTEIGYYHFLFDRHHVIFSNGAPSESLYTGPEAMKSMTPEALREIFDIFPQLKHQNYVPPPARMLIKGKHARNMAERMIKNNKELSDA